MKRIIPITAVCLAAVIAVGAFVLTRVDRAQAEDLMKNITPAETAIREVDDRFADSQVEFAAELFKAVSAESEGENVLVSPLSVQLALAMTANGAKGETLSEMETVLGLPISELNEYMRRYTGDFPEAGIVRLKIANSIWFKDSPDLTVTRDYLQKCADYYGADALSAPFDRSTVKDINYWIKNNTEGLIEKMIDDIDPASVMFIVNTVLFRGEWLEPYYENSIRPGTFTTAAGESREVEMMGSEEWIYLNDGSAEGFMKPYSGERFAFAALLPNDGTDIADYVAGLTGDGIRETLANAEAEQVITATPKFTYDAGGDITDILKGMGMVTPFSAEADFSGMGDSANGNLFVNNVMHKTAITVDERGTKAGAATVVEMNDGAADTEPLTVTLDRPFVYMIVDRDTNIPIFMGAVTDIGE